MLFSLLSALWQEVRIPKDDLPEWKTPARQPLIQTIFDYTDQGLEELRRWLEVHNPQIRASSVVGLADGGMPIGGGCLWFSDTPPDGCVICDGATITDGVTLYPIAAARLSSAYISGNNIVLPDLRGRVPVGKGTHTDVDTVNDNDGLTVGSRRPHHKHSTADPGHTHEPADTPQGPAGFVVNNGAVDNRGGGTVNTGEVSATKSATTGLTVGPQTNAPTDTVAYLVINYIIRLE